MNNINPPEETIPQKDVKSPPNIEDTEININNEHNTVEPENKKSAVFACGVGDGVGTSLSNEDNDDNTKLAKQKGNLDTPIIEELKKSSLDDVKQASNPSSSSSDVQEDELNLKWDDDLDDQDGINSDDQQIKDGQAMDVDKVSEGIEHEVNSELSENLESATNLQKEINTTISENTEESFQCSGALNTEEEIDSNVDNNEENLDRIETVNKKQNLEETVSKISEDNDVKVLIDNNTIETVNKKQNLEETVSKISEDNELEVLIDNNCDNKKPNVVFEETEETKNDKCPELDSTLSTSDENMSMEKSIDINKDHRLTKPDAMIEIPTQELIEFDDDDVCESQSLNLIDNKMDDIVHQGITNDDNNDEEKMGENDKTEIDQPIINDSKESENATETNKDSTDTVKEIINTGDFVTKTDLVNQLQKEDNLQPSTSAQAISAMTPDASDEVPDVSDSLGLLAESSRTMDYDDQDDQEQDDEDDGDDEEDFDQDDESNLMTAEHSEDSNAQQSESDLPKEQSEMDTDNVQEHATVEPIIENEVANKEFEEKEELEEPGFKISQVLTETQNEQEKDALDKDEDVELGQGDDTEISGVAVEMNEAEECSAQQSPEIPAAITEDQETPKDVKTDDSAVDIETVKLSSDTSDNDTDSENKAKAANNSVLRDLLQKEPTDTVQDSQPKQSPSKSKKLEITKQKNFYNIVDLEESSSEDDVQEVQKTTEKTEQNTIELDDVTTVNIPKDIEVICSGENTSEILTKEGDMVISGVPKPKTPHKPTRLNTSEVTIKTASNVTESTLVIPETTMEDKANENTEKSKPKFSLEIFSLDSDDEDSDSKKESLPDSEKPTAMEIEKARESNKCINYSCASGSSGVYRAARAQELAYYDASRRRRAAICHVCVSEVANRTQNLIEGVKDFTPLLELDMDKLSQELVEISDSDSDEESEVREEPKETIGEVGAKLLEEQLADVINSTWKKYKMEARLKDTQDALKVELEKFEKESDEINELLNEAQKATDKLRKDLYATFEQDRKELPALIIHDTPQLQNWSIEDISKETSVPQPSEDAEVETGHKRRMSASEDVPAKRPAIPLGYAPLDGDAQAQVQKSSSPTVKSDSPKVDDDNVDVSVVRLSAEAAPAGLPPPGELRRAPPRPGAPVYAMQNAFGCWLPARVVDCQPKGSTPTSCLSTICRVRFENKLKQVKILSARYLAYWEPADVRMTIGTRVIALCKYSVNAVKRESFYSGIIAEMPNPVNNYRYLVFFDDGYAQYARHGDTRAVCESAGGGAWRDVHAPSRAFVRDYLRAFPERPMVRLRARQRLKTEWNGRWWPAEVLQVDASLAEVQFENGRREWIYRGSTRLAPLYLELQAAERHRARALPRGRATANKNAPTLDMPYVEYTRSDELGAKLTDAQQQEELRRQRAVARKSTVAPALPLPPAAAAGAVPDGVTSRVVYYTPKNAVKPYKMVPHTCGPKCKRTDVLSLKELRTYNPLAKPLLSGWERQIARVRGVRCVLYRAPCGRRVRSPRELHRYLRAVRSDFPVDLFDFNPHTHCLAEFVLNKCHVSKKDLSHGKENVPVPCVNYYDDSLPEFCSYNTERTPTAGVPLNLDPEFLCGCDCTDDCEDKTKCACWKLTLEGARTIGLDGLYVGYEYKRLPEPLPSGIYECNSRCKCRHTCLNRVAQHPLQLKLQVFKTLNRGWGIRALNDVPKGAFLCVYAGNLLTDATANLDGLNEGDEYLAELDYIEVVEQMKEGYEEDIPEGDKELDKKEDSVVLQKESAKKEEEESDDQASSSSEDESKASKNEMEDDDFKPAYGSIGYGLQEFNKRLRKRNKNKEGKENEGKEKEDKEEKEKKEEKDLDEECITISDDEEVRQPSRLTAQPGMGANQYVPKYKSVRSHFGKDEACYIMDAKVQGNIGRYLNHSCSPNVFVQNVFVDTHDPRFPWVAFFALSHVKAGTELTWNYNYDVGSVPDKVLYCYCGAPNCRGRLL